LELSLVFSVIFQLYKTRIYKRTHIFAENRHPRR
jgi:hypothetical protein